MSCMYYRAPVFFRYFIVSVVSEAPNALHLCAFREKHRIVSIVAHSLLNYGNHLAAYYGGIRILAYHIDLPVLYPVRLPQEPP